MTTGARIAFLIFAALYTGWAIGLSRLTLTKSRVRNTSDVQLKKAARKYELLTYTRLGVRASIAFFMWTYAVLAPIASTTTILLAAPLMFVAFAMIILPLVWRHDLRRLHDSGLVP